MPPRGHGEVPADAVTEGHVGAHGGLSMPMVHITPETMGKSRFGQQPPWDHVDVQGPL